MSSILLRDLKPSILGNIRRVAEANHRSVQGEVMHCLTVRYASLPSPAKRGRILSRLRSKIRPAPRAETAVELVRAIRRGG